MAYADMGNVVPGEEASGSEAGCLSPSDTEIWVCNYVDSRCQLKQDIKVHLGHDRDTCRLT